MRKAATFSLPVLGTVIATAVGCTSAAMPFEPRGAAYLSNGRGAAGVPSESDLEAAVALATAPREASRSRVFLLADAQEPAADAKADGAADGAELAKKLSNPVASLISVPFQFNWDSGSGPDERGKRTVVNVQPVVPISLSEEWNIILRTIVPVIDQHEVFPGAGDQSGIGDVVQSWFFSPKKPTADGWIWGAGPVLLLPTAGDELLGAQKWGAGPTALLLKQDSGWTYGALANHIWSFEGDDDRGDVNLTFLQPFLSYTTRDAWTVGLNSEATYDWEADELAVPLNLSVSKLVRLGRLPVQFALGTRYWAERAENGPEGFGFRFGVTFLFPSGN